MSTARVQGGGRSECAVIVESGLPRETQNPSDVPMHASWPGVPQRGLNPMPAAPAFGPNAVAPV